MYKKQNKFQFKENIQQGLSEKEALKRTKQYGFNEITNKKKISPILEFLSYFKNPLVLILIIAAVTSGFTGEIKGAFIILSIVLLSIVLDFYQEHKSNKAAEEIAKKLSVRATVLRDGQKKEVLTKYITLGDVVFLSAGDIVPADGKLFQSVDLFINESALTGESFPVEKNAQNPDGNLVFSGTNVVSGYAQFVVINVGAETEYGKIATELVGKNVTNAFEIGIKKFGYLIIKIAIAIVLVIFLINSLFNRNLIDSFIFSLAIAVGLTPELLPMIMSVTMAKGSINMAKKGVLVKRLSSIPDFGSMDILCTDKTGTLTEDRISLVKHIDVFGNESQKILNLAYINGFFETGIKNVLDKAILDFENIDVSQLKKIDEIPYDFMRKRSSIIYEQKDKLEYMMVSKGAPEEIFKICTSYFDGQNNAPIKKEDENKFNALYEDLSSQGYRVLAIAAKQLVENKTNYEKSEENSMILQGFLAFYDPPKQRAKETLVFMEKHGVEIKILTGDSPLVTKKICEDLGLEITGIVNGEELDINKLDDEAIAHKARHANIFARLSPSQKEKIISVLRKNGKVVGFLGDGINDAPSLKSADVGISVDNAVDVAKETADIILLKKGLRELMDGVIEGRKTFGNTIKYIMMALSSNFGNMFSMIGAVLYLPFFPMLPGQILLNNLLYDSSQISIPTDNVDDDYLAKPKHWDLKFIQKFMYIFGPISSAFDFMTFFVLFSIFHLGASSFQTGWFIESLATQVFVIYVIRTRKIPFLESKPSRYLVFTTLGVMAIGFILAMSSIGKFFGFTPLPLSIILIILALVFVYLIVVEMVKHVFYKKIAYNS